MAKRTIGKEQQGQAGNGGKKPAAASGESWLECPVHFKSVSLPDNKQKATLGVKFPKGKISASAAERFFDCTQLQVQLKVGDPEQLTFEGMDGDPFEAIVSVKGCSVKAGVRSTTLHFEAEAIDESKLSKFRGEDGIFRAKRIGALKREERDADGDEDDIPDEENVLAQAGVGD